MIQQGQVFKLKATCADGSHCWPYRYRIAGRGSARLHGDEPYRAPSGGWLWLPSGLKVPVSKDGLS